MTIFVMCTQQVMSMLQVVGEVHNLWTSSRMQHDPQLSVEVNWPFSIQICTS